MFLKYLFLLLVATLSVALKEKCPPEGVIPCSCEFNNGLSFACNGRDITPDNAESIHNTLKEYKIDRLIVENYTIPKSYGEGAYDGLTINHLVFDKVSLEEPLKEGVKYFKGLEKSLTVLEIENCYATGAPAGHGRLDYLENLDLVIMDNNRMTELGNDWFTTGPKSLHTLLLTKNSFGSIGNKVFSALEGLQILWLTRNDLKEISRSMFPSPAPELRILDIQSNKLQKLPSDLFTDMPALRAVFINNNLIKSLPEDIWPSNLRAQANLHLYENPWQCDSNLKWLCKFYTAAGTCDSPSDKNGITLKSFCDIN